MLVKPRWSGLFAVLLLPILLLTGCAVAVKPSENKPATSDYLRQIDLSIIGVGLGLPTDDTDRALIRQFEKESGARVIIKQTAAGEDTSYLSYLSLLVNSNGLPDVVIFPSFVNTYKKQFLYRLNKFLKEEEMFAALPAPLCDAVSDADSVYALPLRYTLEGYFLRTADCTAQKLTPPVFGLSLHRFFSAAKALAEAGLLTAQPLYAIPYWYPAAKGAGFGWCGYQDGKFHFSDPDFIAGVDYAKQLHAARADKSTASALRYDSTQNLTELKAAGYDAYLGVPDGKAVINPSYIGITRQSAHKKEAFALAKWLSYDPVGVTLRLKDTPEGVFPATRSVKALPCYSYPGIADALENIDQAVINGEDTIPDYQESLEKKFLLSYQKERAFCLEEILRIAVSGELPFAKYAAELEEALSQ